MVLFVVKSNQQQTTEPVTLAFQVNVATLGHADASWEISSRRAAGSFYMNNLMLSCGCVQVA